MAERDLLSRLKELEQRVRLLEQGLGCASEINRLRALGLTFSEAVVLGVLIARKFATRDAIFHALYGDRLDDPPEEKVIDVYMTKLRHKVGLTILCVRSAYRKNGIRADQSGGYQLTPEDRRRIEELLGEQQKLQDVA